MNFTTDLPKKDPISTYLVATGNGYKKSYRMHVVAIAKEYSLRYRDTQILKQIKCMQDKQRERGVEKQRLLDDDI